MPVSMPLLFGSVLAGAVIMDYGVKNAKGAFAGASSSGSSTGSGSVSLGKIGTPPALPQSTALHGAGATVWAAAILAALKAPATAANLSSLTNWFGHEGGGGANNPLNTTLHTTGSTGSINSAGVQNYSSPAAGVTATAKTLLGGGYNAIVAALRAGVGLSNGDGQVASELSTWSGGGYSSV